MERFNETSLPEKYEFYSNLNMKDVNPEVERNFTGYK